MINHLMYMDDIKLFAVNEKVLETLLQTVKIYSKDIGMKAGIEKCTMLEMKSDKRLTVEVFELKNQVVIRTIGKRKLTDTLRY